MIIIENHFRNEDTAIYANVISNGCQTFPIKQFDKVCKEFNVPNYIRDDVLVAFNQNQGADDVNEDIFDKLQKLNNRTLNNAVAFATNNQRLLKKLLISASVKLRDVIASRETLSNNLVCQLAKDENDQIRAMIARRKNLPNKIVVNLSFDPYWLTRAYIAKRNTLPLPIIEHLSHDKDPHVRRQIAMLEDLNETIIEQLAKDNYVEIRCIIAKKKKTLTML